MTQVSELYTALRAEVAKVIVGQDDAVRCIFIALIAEGHVLLQGVPGVAKTLLARTVAGALGIKFARIQFTPDLMPADILGTQVFQFQEGKFHLVEGPIFTHLLLADEINRAPAKTQSALLEAMQERQVSIEGHSRSLPSPFLVLATQNPVEYEGTYRLPEAQLDRFLFQVVLDYPSLEDELQILTKHGGDTAGLSALLNTVSKVAGAEELAQTRREALAVHFAPDVQKYLVELVRSTRNHDQLQLGGSPRSALWLQIAARINAGLEERDFVIPDDVKSLYLPVLRHRVILTAAAEVEGLKSDDVLREITNAIPVPR